MKLNSIVLATSSVLLVVSFWNRNDLPGSINYVPEIENEPQQRPTMKAGFDVTYDDVEYRVEPEFEYELTGMVVSYRHHDGNSFMHRMSNDHLNMMDVCVVWGENTANPHLDRLNFWNGVFTCNVETKDQVAWDAFDMYQLSNNHLISDNLYIRDQVLDVNVGDQVRVRGYLASYGANGSGMRGTSTTRRDTGDGACETIFVESFEIVEAATSNWRRVMYVSLIVLILSLFIHFKRPYRPYDNT